MFCKYKVRTTVFNQNLILKEWYLEKRTQHLKKQTKVKGVVEIT
jgi:hypothetical protein